MRATRLPSFFLFVGVMACAVPGLVRAVEPAAGPEVAVKTGEDWSLPDWVRPLPYSGLYTMNTGVRHPLIRHIGMTLTWADLNPAEGVYDFSVLEKYLALAKARSGMVLFRLKASILDAKEQGVVDGQRQMIPQWVMDKHHPKTFRTKADKLYAAPWDPGVQAEFRELVREIGRRKYLESEQLMAIYLHGVSTSFGEEMNINEEAYTNEAKTAGLTAEVLLDCWKARMDWWAEAAGRNIAKVIWVGSGNIHGLPYPKEELDAYALKQGLGWRAGFIEHYFYPRLHPPVAGQTYDSGYIVSAPQAPLRDGRYFGDENETIEFAGSKGEVDAVLARSPYFRAVQVGLNFLWVSRETLDWVGEGESIARWYTLLAGKGPADSPEAACWLREASVRGLTGPEAAPWKNMEHLLMQRDVPGAMSVGDELHAMPYVQLKDRKNTAEYTARRTDLARGQDRMAFRLEAGFKSALTYPVQIKVHYRDKTRALWTVSIPAADGRMVDLGTVQGRGDQVWRTATFTVREPLFSGPSGGETDFAVRVLSGGDVTVRYVRVVKLAPP